MGNGVNKTMEIKAGMPVQYVLKNGTPKQQKFAPVFDANRNGVYEANEAQLFNTMKLPTRKNEDGAYIFAKPGNEVSVPNPNYKKGQPDLQLGIVKYIPGQNVELYDTEEQVITEQNNGLNITDTTNGNKQYMNKAKYMELKSEDNLGNKTYITKDPYGTGRDEIVKLDMYGNLVYSKEPVVAGEAEQDMGYVEYKNGITKHYNANNKLIGSYGYETSKDGKNVRVIKDANNKLLYKEVLNAKGETLEYIDPENNTYKLTIEDNIFARLTKYDKNGKFVESKNGRFISSGCDSSHDQFTSLLGALPYDFGE